MLKEGLESKPMRKRLRKTVVRKASVTGSRAVACQVVIILVAVLLGIMCIPSVHAEPVVRVLFGDTCSFLPEREPPEWLFKRPRTDDKVGVGSADRMPKSSEQIQVAEQNARAELAKEIEVSVKEEVKIFMEERNDSAMKGISHEGEQQISLEARQVVDQMLSGSEIRERYLDRKNCVTYALAIAPKAAVEAVQKKLAEQLRRQFKLKPFMLLDRSEGRGEVTAALRAQLEGLFTKIGNKLVASKEQYGLCSDDSGQPQCKELADTIFAGYKVLLDSEETAAGDKRRIYRLIGQIRFKDRLIASFNVACQGTGKVGEEHLIDQRAAGSCFEKAKPTIAKGMEGSE
ncbi:exported hypothetical protein [Candidatus Nitrospira nitrificans]|uniref:Uncharacterized protein n=2 Tax=Candidatus Nitrospira nitrificans TaxID=1742973 RepID=A0A0S4LJW9_9BACT|nr:exported hypothetical protein [Candidatus Nitrospira nitrificans]